MSIATVNRVLNERGSVSPEMRARVIAAAKQLGVPRVLPDPRHGLTRFDVVLARSDTPYFRRLDLALDRLAQMIDPRILIHRHVVDPRDAEHVAAVLARPTHRRDGLMIALQDTEGVRLALREQAARGVPIAALMSSIQDVPGVHYAGIDNLAAGRTAGHFIARMVPPGPARVLLLTHTLGFRAHADRVEGCRQVLQAQRPDLDLVGPLETLDDTATCRRLVAEQRAAALREGRPLRGLYLSGAGSEGVASVLAGGAPADRAVWVGHELSDEHRQALRDGALDLVIDQDPDGQVASALHHLMHAAAYVDTPPRRAPNEFRIFCAENLGPVAYLEAPLRVMLPR